MLTNEDLQAISQLLNPINTRLDAMDARFDKIEKDISDLKSNVAEMKEDIEVIKEDCEITRDGTNHLGEWVEYYFGDIMPYPLDREKADKEQSILNLINVIERQKK